MVTARQVVERACDVLRLLTADAVADHGDTELAYALAAARYEAWLGLPPDPQTWALAGLPLPATGDAGEA